MSPNRGAFVLGLVLAVAVGAPALATDCQTNPLEPAQLDLVIQSSGSDVDLGWKRKYHNFGVPAASGLHLCLSHCDRTSDPICDVEGQAGGVAVDGDSLGPPIPAVIDNGLGPADACITVRFAEPAISGTANVETGALDISASFTGEVQLVRCPTCDGAVSGQGTCTGGTAPGAACTVDQQIVLTKNLPNDTTLDVSADCVLAPGGFAVALTTVPLTSGTSMLSNVLGNACPGQIDYDECSGTCSAVCTGAAPPHGGQNQVCCSGSQTTRPCFPSAISRTGSATPPGGAQPWPDPAYPKTGAVTLAGAFCAPTAGLLADNAVGLPGPVAMILPFDSTVLLGDSTTTTTTTSTTTTTTVTTTTSTTSTIATTTTSTSTSTTTTTQPCDATCLIDQALATTPCAGTPLDPKLSAAITTNLMKARTLVGQTSGATAKKKAKLLKKAVNAIKAFQKKATKLAAKKKNPLPSACAAEINALGGELTTAIQQL